MYLGLVRCYVQSARIMSMHQFPSFRMVHAPYTQHMLSIGFGLFHICACASVYHSLQEKLCKEEKNRNETKRKRV